MKQNINYGAVACIILLCFSVAYLLTRLIMKGLYIDAAFAALMTILFVLLIYFMKKGK